MVVGESSGGREERLQTKDDAEQRVREKRMSDFFRAYLFFVFVFIFCFHLFTRLSPYF